MKIVLCMATGHNPVNILPLESPEIRPNQVCVAVTEGKRENGQELISQIQSIGIKTERLDVPNENSLQQLITLFENWLLAHEQHDIVVNVTGGTKLMSIAAYQVFNSYGIRCFYQNLSPSHLIWLDDETIVSDIGHKISLERYLAQYQFKIRKSQPLTQVPAFHKTYTQLILDDLKRHFENSCLLISKLNGLAAEKMDPAICQDIRNKLTQEEEGFIEHLAYETKIFKLSKTGLEFSNIEDRALVAGGWLEVLVANTLKEVTKTRDLSVNTVFEKSTSRIGSASKNEMDVMAMIGPVLYLAECKTIRWEGKTNATPEESIYKLSALSDIGGLNTRSAFVSLYDVKGVAKTRAAENGIELICGRELINLPARLQRWVAAQNS